MAFVDLFPVGTRVRWTQAFPGDFPLDVVKFDAGATGTVVDRAADPDADRYLMVLLDHDEPGLDEWNNELQVWCWDDCPDRVPDIEAIGFVTPEEGREKMRLAQERVAARVPAQEPF